MNNKNYSNFSGYLAHIFTTNTPLSLIVLFAAIAVGLISYFITPKQYNPEVIRPVFVISTQYKGASSYEVNQFLTQSIVEDVQGIEGVEEVLAQSIDGGMSMVTAIFYVGENEEDSKTKLFTKIMQNTEIKKPGISEPYIVSVSPDDVPILTLFVSSEEMSQNMVRKKVSKILNDFKKIKDVSEVLVYGGQEPALVIRLDRLKMESYGISIQEVSQTLEIYNKRIVTQGIKNGNRVIAFEINNYLKSAKDAQNILIRKNISLSDIASVYTGFTEKNSFVEFDDNNIKKESGIFISFAKKKGSNTSTVSKNIQKKVSHILEKEFNGDIKMTLLRDNGEVANNEIMGLMMNLIISIAIVGIILYLFLSAKPALIVMGAIPITLLLVFIPGYLAGQTINRITLFALILSLGLLVDSATVVVENIYRNIRNHPDKKVQENIVRAVNQVGTGLVLSTITSVVVFIPVGYITGMMGPYMGPISFFVPIVLIISMFIAFIITPFLAHMSFKKGLKEQKALLDPLFKKVANFYEKNLTKVLLDKKKIKTILISLVVLFVASLAMPALKFVHFQMLPKADNDQIYVHIDLPYGSDILKTNNINKKAVNIILKNDSVDSVQSFIGTAPIPDFNGLFKGVQSRMNPYQSTLRVNLDKDKNESSIKITSEIRKSLHDSLILPHNSVVKVLEDPPGPPVQATYVVEIYGPDALERENISKEIIKEISKIKGLVDIDHSYQEPYERILMSVDQQKAQEFGVDVNHLYTMIQMVTDSYQFSQLHQENGEFSYLDIAFPRSERKSLDKILSMEIPSLYGGNIALSDFVDVTHTKNDSTIFSKDADEYEYITGEVDNRSIVYIVLDSFNVIKEMDWKGQYEVEQTSLNSFELRSKNGDVYSIVFDGEWGMTLNNFRDLGIAMLAALLLVYTILVAQYKSFIVPGLIMTTIPLGLVGILFGFTFLDIGFDIYLTATALIGFIALIGIVVNNAILYLEYFEELIDENPNMDHYKALVMAGKVRLRPIMLTSMTTVLANLTIVSDPVWSGLGWAIIFGLSLSTIMTLVVFPILYIHFDAYKGREKHME